MNSAKIFRDINIIWCIQEKLEWQPREYFVWSLSWTCDPSRRRWQCWRWSWGPAGSGRTRSHTRTCHTQVYSDRNGRMRNFHNFKNLYLWQSKGVLKVASTWNWDTNIPYTKKIFSKGESFFNKPTVIEGSADNLSCQCGDNLVKCLFVKMLCRFLKC